MSDQQLCEHVARIWVDAGGDADGLSWCFRMLKAAIEAEMAARKEPEAT